MFRFWYVCNVYLRWNYTNRTHQQHRHTTHAQMHCKLWWWRWWCSVHASNAYRALCFTSQHSIDDINLPRKRTCINAGVVRMCSFYIALSPLCSMYIRRNWGGWDISVGGECSSRTRPKELRNKLERYYVSPCAQHTHKVYTCERARKRTHYNLTYKRAQRRIRSSSCELPS